MNKIYLEFKGKEVILGGFKGILCGYTQSNFVLVLCEGEPIWSFEDEPYDAFIEEEFKGKGCRFGFLDEKHLWS